jgi:hypothetical protein
MARKAGDHRSDAQALGFVAMIFVPARSGVVPLPSSARRRLITDAERADGQPGAAAGAGTGGRRRTALSGDERVRSAVGGAAYDMDDAQRAILVGCDPACAGQRRSRRCTDGRQTRRGASRNGHS